MKMRDASKKADLAGFACAALGATRDAVRSASCAVGQGSDHPPRQAGQKLTVVDLASETATEVTLGGGHEAALALSCRRATETELTRQDGTEALLRAVRRRTPTSPRTNITSNIHAKLARNV